MTRRTCLRSIACLLLAACQPIQSRGALPEADTYEQLHTQWLEKALELAPEIDPRLDTDILRPVVTYDRAIIDVRSTGSGGKLFLAGGGWQLIGSLIDRIDHGEATYLLLGRQALYYRGGLWNNSIDHAASFEEFFLLMRDRGQTRIITRQRIDPLMSQSLIGIRSIPGMSGLEVIRNTTDGNPRPVFSHRF